MAADGGCNGGPLHVRLNGELLEEVDCSKWQRMEVVKGMWYTE